MFARVNDNDLSLLACLDPVARRIVRIDEQPQIIEVLMSLARRVLVLAVSALASSHLVGQSPEADATRSIHIRFGAVLDGKPFTCGTKYMAHGLHDVEVTPADLRFYISSVDLVTSDGTLAHVALDQDGLWQYRDVVLIDLEDGKGGCRNGNTPMHQEISGRIANGHYTGIRFTLGLPFDLAHLDPVSAPAPLNFTAMSWAWQAGLKFLRAELLVENKLSSPTAATTSLTKEPMAMGPGGMMGRSGGFPIHIGSTGCVASSITTPPLEECAHPNLAMVKIDDFDPDVDSIVLDMDRLIAGAELIKNHANSAPGCMSGQHDEDCAAVFHALGLPFGSLPPAEQIVFKKAVR